MSSMIASTERAGTGFLPDRTRLRFIVTTIPSDSHTWNLVFLQLMLEGMGHEVVNLGACVPTDVLIEECRLRRPDAVVVSSVNGLANIEAPAIIEALRGSGDGDLAGLPVIIGGKLGILGVENQRYGEQLRSAGFDAVFTADEPIDRFLDFCEQLELLPGGPH